MASVVVGGSCSALPALALRHVASGLPLGGFSKALLLQLFRIGSVAAVVTIGVDVYVFGATSAIRLGTLAAAASLALALLTTLSAVRSGQRRYLLASGGELLGGFMTLAFASIGIALGYGLPGALLGLTLGPIAGASLMVRGLLTDRAGNSRRSVDLGLKKLLPFITLGFAGTGYIRADQVLLAAVSSQIVLGQYSAAYRVVGIFTLLGSAFGTIFFSLASSDPHNISSLKRATLLFATLVSVPALIFFAFANDIVVTLFGASYLPAAGTLRILLLAIVPYGLYWPTAQYLIASGRERTYAMILVTSTATDMLLLIMLAPRLGASGAAAAWVAAETVTFLLCSIAVWRCHSERTNRLPSPAENKPN